MLKQRQNIEQPLEMFNAGKIWDFKQNRSCQLNHNYSQVNFKCQVTQKIGLNTQWSLYFQH